MYKIQTNASGTRSIDITDEHLAAIENYSLLKGLIPSNGIIDETILETLKQNAKSYILNNNDCDDLVDLCTNVLYHDNMKVYGLKELIILYVGWKERQG